MRNLPSLVIALVIASTLSRSDRLFAASDARDPELQEQLRKTVTKIVEVNNGHGSEAALASLDRLNEIALGNRNSLLFQIALYLKDSDSTEESMGGAALLQYLNFSDQEKLDAVLPRMNRGDVDLDKILGEILSTIDRPDGGEPDFSFYELQITSGVIHHQWALIDYMYDTSLSHTLVTLLDVYAPSREDRLQILNARDIVNEFIHIKENDNVLASDARPNVRRCLNQLISSQAEWVRLYVAKVIRRAPEIATPLMIERLERDSNELVRDTIRPLSKD